MRGDQPLARSWVIALVVLVTLGPVVIPGSVAEHMPEAVVPFQVHSAEASGAIAFKVSNPVGILFESRMNLASKGGAFNPFDLLMIFPDGTTLWHQYWGSSSPQWGSGPGVVYVGTGDAHAEVSGTQGSVMRHTRQEFGEWSYTEAWLVFVWDRQEGPWWFNSTWREGTAIEFVSEGTAVSFEMKDFRGGSRAGVPAVARYHSGDRMGLDPGGGQMVGSISYKDTDVAGFGRFVVEREDGFRRELEYVGVHDPSSTCICFRKGAWYFTSTLRMDAFVDYLGDGSETAIWISFGVFPVTFGPDLVWNEWNVRTGP